MFEDLERHRNIDLEDLVYRKDLTKKNFLDFLNLTFLPQRPQAIL